MKKTITIEKAVVSRCPECNRILVTDLSITRGHGATCYIGKLERRIEQLEDRLATAVAFIKTVRGQ